MTLSKLSKLGFEITIMIFSSSAALTNPFKVPAAARAGAISPVDVVVPAQATTLGPEKTSFFQVSFGLLTSFQNFGSLGAFNSN